MANEWSVIHGLSKTVLYKRWSAIKQRCYNKKDKKYSVYGARGIKVCDDWRNSVEKFYNWSIENGYEERLTLERKDVNGDYSPENCTWIPLAQQAQNRQDTVWIPDGDKLICASEYCRQHNLSIDQILDRIQHGWRPIDAVTIPIGQINPQRILEVNLPMPKEVYRNPHLRYPQYRLTMDNGKKLSLRSYCKLYNISFPALNGRLKKMSFEEAIKIPFTITINQRKP